MTDPTSPQPDNPFIMPGVRDYQAHLTFKRPSRDGAEDTRVVTVRVPAATADDASLTFKTIAFRIETANHGQAGWRFDTTAGMQITDVDHTQSPAEVAAERDHWKRVLAALATKLPMTLQLTAGEYDAADPAGLHAVPLGENGMMFMTAAVMQAMTDAADITNEPLLLPAHEQLIPRPGLNLPEIEALIDGQWQHLVNMTGDGARPGHVAVAARRPGVDHQWYQVPDNVPVLVRNVQPARHGGYEDPDVRRVRARNLGVLPDVALEMLVHGEWLRMGRVDLEPSEDGGEVRVHYWIGDGPDTKKWVTFHPVELVTVRPYTIEAYGSDVAATEWLNKQMLLPDGWWTIDTTGQDDATGGVKVRLSRGSGSRTVSVPADDPVLLRPPVPAFRWP